MLRMNNTIKISQIGMSPQIPETASATQAEDITRSEQIMIFFLSCWSISTPMNIPSTAWGRNPASVAKERTAADFVFPVIYHRAGQGRYTLAGPNYKKLLSPSCKLLFHGFFRCLLCCSFIVNVTLSHGFSPTHIFSPPYIIHPPEFISHPAQISPSA